MIQLPCDLQGSFLSLKCEMNCLLNKKRKVGGNDKLNTGGHLLLLLSAYRAVALPQYQPEMETVTQGVTDYLFISQLLQRSLSLHPNHCIPPGIFYVRKYTKGRNILRIFLTPGLPGHPSEEMRLCRASFLLNAVGCGMPCQKGVGALPYGLNKPWPDPESYSFLCMRMIEK